MRILITFIHLKDRTGGELYIYELALELLRLQHTPIIFTSQNTGALFYEIQRKGIPITTNLETISCPPDIILGNSHEELMLALLYFSNVPAVFISHDRFAWYAIPPKFSRLYRYLTPSQNIADGFLYEQALPKNKIIIHPNAVDTKKFKTRSPLPHKPKKALIFSNYINTKNQIAIIKNACTKFNITLDTIGARAGNPVANPENSLPHYDLVFAKGRCALEALAVGCAVILCDVEGLGAMITSQNVTTLRYSNFGWRLLQNSLSSEAIAAEILKYDAQDVEKITLYIREAACLEKMTRELVQTLDLVIQEHQNSFTYSAKQELIEFFQYLKQDRIYFAYSALQESLHDLNEKCQHLEKQLQETYQSSSWRLTAPCRKIMHLIRKTMTWRAREKLNCPDCKR